MTSDSKFCSTVHTFWNMCQGCGLRRDTPHNYFGPYGVGHRYGQGGVVMTTRSRIVSEYLFLEWAGMHSPHQKVEGLLLSVLIFTRLQCTWLTDNLIRLWYDLVFRTGIAQSDTAQFEYGNAIKDNNTTDLLINSKSVGVPGMGPVRELYGA